jgi:NADH:ubiquinone oxidoreductase subunit 6 (subunit J)
MSRAGTADVVTVKPANNVYTVLALISFLIVIAALLALYIKANALFGEGGILS